MKIFTWNDIQSYLNTGNVDSFFSKGSGISIGSFDGLHTGHRTLLKALVQQCKANSLLSGAVTFVRPLPSIKHHDDYKGDVSTLNQRLKILEQLGLDFVIIVKFTEDFSSLLGADFLNILVNACNMEFIAEGIDFRCGYKGATDVQAIKYFAQKNNLKTVFVDPVYYKEGTDEEERISSSYIRQMILKGFFSTAEELLERKYQLELCEIKDNSEGVEAVNLSEITQVIPPQGIYHCKNEQNEEVRVVISKNEISVSKKSFSIDF